MGTASLRIDLSDMVALDGRLAAAHAHMQDLRPLMDAIGQAMEASTDERFDAEAAPDSAPWEQSERARLDGGKTLTDDTRLRRSITHVVGISGDPFTEVGSNLIYARPHNLGWAEGGLPQRQFLGLGGDDEATIAELAGDFMMEGMTA
jgi:phage virion morphogenesis protein